MLEKTLESPLDYKEIKQVKPKGNQSWIFIGRTDAEAPILWLPDSKKWLVGKDPGVGKNWRQEEKRTTEDEMVGWHHQLDGHELEQAWGIGDGQGGLVCCSPWGGRAGHDWATELNWTDMHTWITFAQKKLTQHCKSMVFPTKQNIKWDQSGCVFLTHMNIHVQVKC